MLKTKLLGATAAAQALAIEDVFSTYLYTGNGSTQTITNGIDLAGEGGLVWIKSRTSTTSNWLMDTERGMNGVDAFLSSNTSNPAYDASSNGLTPNADGFSHVSGNADLNASGTNYASWTWRKAPRWFDVVTYTGNGVANRAIAHNLGTTVGSIFIKRTDTTRNWAVYHRSTTAYDYSLRLNTTDAQFQDNYFSAAPDSSNFYIDKSPGGDLNVNASGGTYVAYLFAHDPLGPSGDGSDGLIACGSVSGFGTTVNIGWEPQWLLVKRSDSTGEWVLVDNMRGIATGGKDAVLYAHASDAETSANDWIDLTSTGFTNLITAGTCIYIAIRRGPMREPTSGTEVYTAGLNPSGSYTVSTGWPADFAIQRNRTATNFFSRPYARLTGTNYLETTSTAAESGGGTAGWANNTGYSNSTITSTVDWLFRRAPGFFDVVAYQGNNVAGRTVPHNLGVAPEMMIVKSRQITNSWFIYHKDLGATYAMNFDTSAAFVNTASWNSTAPTDSVFTLGGTGGGTNAATSTFIAYLFATLPGVSKVGSYTGNGSNQTINCGFTSGARFVLIKRTDSTGDWLIGDTARGIVAGNDPYLELNTTAAEDTDEDWLDPDSSGFIVNETSTANANVSSATYIYLAIA